MAVSDVLSVVAGACFMDAFIVFVIVGVLLTDKQGQFKLRWPWSSRPGYNSRFGHVEQKEQRPLDYATWQEAGGVGWTPQAMPTSPGMKHFTMGRIRHKWTKHQWILPNGRQ